ncbi:MAG: DNA-protecting protein DprA [Spirochaetales bacterium]|jgi:DNA processing protein|nr:DNA-protecting protein DprA [Spirochaetales bacterium]
MNCGNLLRFAVSRLRSLPLKEKLLLCEVLSDPEDFAALCKSDLEQILQRHTRIKKWNPAEQLAEAAEDEKALTRGDFNYTFYWDKDYPPLLREIFDPPFLLYFRGNLPDPEKPGLAVVGTRYPSGNGLREAFRLGLEAGGSGIAVISGLAKGIDNAAHKGNTSGGGRSVAVLGCGIDFMYPRSSIPAAHEMLKAGGCVLSEYGPGTEPRKYNFPERNRIISGLARSVVVMEAPARSGALITADFALEQGRELYVHAACLHGKNGEGCRRLHAEGAKAADGWSEIAEDWGLARRKPSGSNSPVRKENDNRDGELAVLLEKELNGKLVAYAGEHFER